MKREDVIDDNHYCGDEFAVERLLEVLPNNTSEEVKTLLAIPEGGSGTTKENAESVRKNRQENIKRIQDKLYKKITDTFTISCWSLIVGILSLLVSIFK